MRCGRYALVLALVVVLLGGAPAPAGASGAGQPEACFDETGYCVQGRFLAYWEANGGLARHGYPLSGARQELLEDGKVYTVQYFERVRMELHPENQPPYDVLLGQFGRRALYDALERYDTGGFRGSVQPATPQPHAAYFPETGHNVSALFFDYWQANGGLNQFGYPLTEEGLERIGPPTREEPVATFLRVQYFERARLEYHPENVGSPYVVLLGQFGRQILQENELLSGDFRTVYLTSESAQQHLGAPSALAVQSVGAILEFERGRMIWRGDLRQIYVLCGDRQAGQLVVNYGPPQMPYFPDTWSEGQEVGGGPAPVPGRFLPKRGFAKVWREQTFVRECLGYALTADETGYTLLVQEFGEDIMLLSPDQLVYVIDVDRGSRYEGIHALP